MQFSQYQLEIGPFPKGSHLITREIVGALPQLKGLRSGLLHIFIQHTSASLSINENADADVRRDLDMALDHLVPETLPYRHTEEGADDMPAHVKAVLCGPSVTIPVQEGAMKLGTWQGVYLNEHRLRGGKRTLFLTMMGQ